MHIHTRRTLHMSNIFYQRLRANPFVSHPSFFFRSLWRLLNFVFSHVRDIH